MMFRAIGTSVETGLQEDTIPVAIITVLSVPDHRVSIAIHSTITGTTLK